MMRKNDSKPRIAVMGMGTFDAGPLGIPVMIDLFTRLSTDFDIVFYSFLAIDKSTVPNSITVKQPIAWKLPGRIKYFLVGLRCVWDHLMNPFSLYFAVSIYPTALCATILERLFNTPAVIQLISTEGGAEPNVMLGNMTIPWLKKMTLSVCARAHTVVVVGDYQNKFAKTNLTTHRDIVVLPLRINTALFPFRARKLSYPVQFIQVGFYGPIKDQDTMFAAFAKVAERIDCHLTVVGHGFDCSKVHQMMNDLKIVDKVTFTGYVRNDVLRTYLDKAHILLHSAVFETGCAVVQEAMASGVAVCGTRVGILHDIGDGYASTFQPSDPDEMATTILELVNDPIKYSGMIRAASQWIRTYDAEWSHRNYLAFLKELIAIET